MSGLRCLGDFGIARYLRNSWFSEPRRLGSAVARSVSLRHIGGAGFRPNLCMETPAHECARLDHTSWGANSRNIGYAPLCPKASVTPPKLPGHILTTWGQVRPGLCRKWSRLGQNWPADSSNAGRGLIRIAIGARIKSTTSAGMFWAFYAHSPQSSTRRARTSDAMRARASAASGGARHRCVHSSRRRPRAEHPDAAARRKERQLAQQATADPRRAQLGNRASSGAPKGRAER